MFPMNRDGHRYSFGDGGLHYQAGQSPEILFPFDEQGKLKFSAWTGKLRFQGRFGKVPLAPLAPEEQKALVLETLRRWRTRFPDAAKKAAFDYIDGQKGFAPVAFVACLFFSLPLSIGLLADSKDQFYCTSVLHRSSTVGEMQVTKFKKKRKGHYILDLAFTAPSGALITGRDQLITMDETTIPKTVPVVYSPENPQCWSLTPNLQGTEVNWAKRRYFGAFTLIFGTFFLLTSLWGIAWSLMKWKRKRPYREDVAAVFSL